MMHDWWSWGPSGWGMGFGHLVWLVALVLIIALPVAALVRGGWGSDRQPPHNKTPREILDERFARGEISKEEYDERRRVLGV
jgi:putative membrane protein